MLSIGNLSETPQQQKIVRFSAEVEKNEIVNIKKKEAKAIISLLIDATGLCSKNPLGSMEIVEKALLKVSNTFNEGTPEYRTLRAKVLIKKATLLDPIERNPLIEEANSLDPTREKFYLSF
jgi:hypothetical protein